MRRKPRSNFRIILAKWFAANCRLCPTGFESGRVTSLSSCNHIVFQQAVKKAPKPVHFEKGLVLAISNLPEETTISKIKDLLASYGPVKRILWINEKNLKLDLEMYIHLYRSDMSFMRQDQRRHKFVSTERLMGQRRHGRKQMNRRS